MTGAMLPLALQFPAAWLAVWLERVLQAQVDLGLTRPRTGHFYLALTSAL